MKKSPTVIIVEFKCPIVQKHVSVHSEKKSPTDADPFSIFIERVFTISCLITFDS